MSNNKNAKVTAESVAAQAAEENLVVPSVPAQNEKASEPKVVDVVEETGEDVELEVIEGGKKSLKERLVGVTEKLKENKKVVAGVAVSVALAAVAFAKFAAKQTAEEQEQRQAEIEEIEELGEKYVQNLEETAKALEDESAA
ncbi:hypothetical protein SEA_GIRLPOWER_43 [Streptomyces phage GirlPower]|nr:hypothetical protein SEA_GIRLPOWER_43 [Streptomyces phage GirlPower]